jgi:uncharacterized protein YegJ (DUF2314 family)
MRAPVPERRGHVVPTSVWPYCQSFALILGAARAAGLKDRPPRGKVPVKKAEHDALVILAMNDRVMAAAVHGARKTLRKFLTLAKKPGPTMDGFAVKIAISAENGAEFFWIHPFAHVGDRFIGQINNTPRSVVNLKMGDTVTFVRNEIVDWMYMDAGRMRGNYSAHAILRSVRPDDRKVFIRRFGLDSL